MKDFRFTFWLKISVNHLINFHPTLQAVTLSSGAVIKKWTETLTDGDTWTRTGMTNDIIAMAMISTGMYLLTRFIFIIRIHVSCLRIIIFHLPAITHVSVASPCLLSVNCNISVIFCPGHGPDHTVNSTHCPGAKFVIFEL